MALFLSAAVRLPYTRFPVGSITRTINYFKFCSLSVTIRAAAIPGKCASNNEFS